MTRHEPLELVPPSMPTYDLEPELDAVAGPEDAGAPAVEDPQVTPMLAPEIGPAEVAELVRSFPASRDLILQGAANLHGNAFVAEVMRLLNERPPGVEPDPDDRSRITRHVIATHHLPDDARADAEKFNRGHIPNVVKFDRGTFGAYAKINGELDADGVAVWQLEHDLQPTGRVDDDTIAVLSKVGPRGGPGPGPAPSPSPEPVPDLSDVLPGELAKILDDLLRGKDHC